MVWTPISNTVPQYYAAGVPAINHYIKFYAGGTTTPILMATDSTGATTLIKSRLDSEGYPLNGSSDIFIPHIDQLYKIALFANATDADSNNLANAVWAVDNILPNATTDIINGYKRVYDNIAAVIADTDLSVGQSIATLGYRTPNDGGEADYVIVAGGTGTNDGGSYHDLDNGNQAELIFDGNAVLIEWFGAIPNDTSQGVKDDNHASLQAAINFASGKELRQKSSVGKFWVDNDSPLIFSGDWSKFIGVRITSTAATANCMETASLSQPIDVVDSEIYFEECEIRSENGNAIEGRFRESKFLLNRFSAPLGRGINIIADANSTGNKVHGNFFTGCKYGFYGQSGTRKVSDLEVTSNRFWAGEGVWAAVGGKEADIYLESGSGHFFSGNHYFGGANQAFVVIASGGFSSRMVGDYFEANNLSPHIIFATGNVGSWSFVGNTFWCESTMPHSIEFNMNFEAKHTFSANAWHTCVNQKIFSVNNQTNATQIYFGGNNTLQGTIDPAGFNDNILFGEPTQSVQTFTDRFVTADFTRYSSYRYTSETDPTGTITLSINANTANEKSIWLYNFSTLTTVTLALSGTAAGLGFLLKGKSTLAPGEAVRVIVDIVNKYAISGV